MMKKHETEELSDDDSKPVDFRSMKQAEKSRTKQIAPG
jgi:hypothetical protein